MHSTGTGIAAAPGQGAPEPVAVEDTTRGERRKGFGVREWSDGSRYEGEFENGLKHGRGKYTFSSGEYYEGSFYKDYRHGDGQYCWPSGHKFTGKFYLNRKEGYGHQVFSSGATFQGLYHMNQRLGPGVMSYPSGRQDVGLWYCDLLVKLCTSLEDTFSLKEFPEYAAFMEPAAATNSVTEPSASGQQSDLRTDSEVDQVSDILLDESFIFPPGLESYSTDGDHLPLPPGRRREFDQQFFGELFEPDSPPQRGWERDPLSKLPLQARISANIHKHRRQAVNVDWDVAAVVSLNRVGFGPKGPLEVSSEQWIHHASRGELEAMLQIFNSGAVYPDVTDSQGHTALMAATVNCHNDVIHLLLDRGVDIDKLNSEGMSALAVCHVLYYPYQSLNITLAQPLTKSQVLRSFSVYENNNNNNKEVKDEEVVEECVRNSQEKEEEEKRGEGQEETGGEDRGSEEKCRREEDEEGDGEQRETESREEMAEVIKEEAVEDGVEGVSNIQGREEEECYIQVLDGHIPLGSVQWKRCGGGRVQNQDFDSACSVSSYSVQVTEEMMQLSAEALSRTGIPQSMDTQETVRRMAAMKMEHRARLTTLKLLLERGADPNLSRVPVPVLFLAIMAADSEVVERLLQCGARSDIPLPPERKGLYPLHVAAALPGSAGPTITEMLLHANADPDTRACDQDEIYEADKIYLNQEQQSNNVNRDLKKGGRTPLHVACQRESDYQNASKVVALLLAHRASTNLLWSGHSPLSLAIAAGNELAVEELLKGGADPNMCLGDRVGSALCVLSNFHYLGGNRTKLLEMLMEAGADIMMPVMVGEVEGTAVDYAHNSFKQHLRIANTPFQHLNFRERETFNTRRQLLRTMGNLLRQTAVKRETERHLTAASADEKGAEVNSTTTETNRPVFKFCFDCGRSMSMKLKYCKRRHKVFCSSTCQQRAMEKGHCDNDVEVTRRNQGRSVGQAGLSFSFYPPAPDQIQTPHRAPMSVEEMSDSLVNLRENYSFI